ncbi:vWA domain-containing protein [Candidatus Marinarcus aquaticus]|uniref:VWA domain-containing protein n=1 Tax=Candidatus Marinarcus aquaticus TaxID=2044504 RepID=A0A4Q0XUB8_9BACT|nr:VWA domain-containing protein [Candidatus Marinarcus aquaticus]RXJ60505.1 VWA domain-containing protein [Candidatus Marinarcus aquaticus]
MFDIQFEYPYVLLLIALFIACAFLCKTKFTAYYFPHIQIYQKSRILNYPLTSFLKWITIVCTLIALASPIIQEDTHIIKNQGIDIVLNLDTSASMKELGLDNNNRTMNRWQVTRDIVKQFIQKRTSDNIALVVFGSQVMMASPLSFDKQAQAQIIDYLDIGIIGDKTALIDSLANSVNILKHSQAHSKVIVLLTDGEDTASQIPLQVIEKLLKKHKIKVYTIGIGDFNPLLLKHIASVSNGASFMAKSKKDLLTIYEQIDQLEKSKIENNKIVLKEYLFFYPLFCAVMALIGFIYFKNKNEII